MPPPKSPRLRYLPPPCEPADFPVVLEERDAISNIPRSIIPAMSDDGRDVFLGDVIAGTDLEDLNKYLHRRRIVQEMRRIPSCLTSISSLQTLDQSLIKVLSVCDTEKS